MAMKKTDLYKNLALLTAQRMKNAAKTPKPGTSEEKARTKQELAKANPLLASLMGGGSGKDKDKSGQDAKSPKSAKSKKSSANAQKTKSKKP